MNFSRTRNAPIAFPGVTHQGALGAPSSGTAARPRRGIQISLGSGARSSCESPGGPCWDLGRAAASSLLTPLSSEQTGMKSHPVRGEPGQGAGESQAGLRATPPGSRRSLAEVSGTECPRRRGPKRPSPSLAASPPCLGRSKQETQDLTWRDPDFWPGFPLSRYFTNCGMFRVSSFRFRGKGPNVKTYQICPSVFIKNEYLTREGSPFNDCGHSTAAFVFVLLCF
nr:PREDICTED: uncharacterized protein LOC109460843 [Rhinolophus sinicus]